MSKTIRQITLFKEEQPANSNVAQQKTFTTKNKKTITVSVKDDKHTPEYCLNYLKTSQSIWDMRAWKKHKDKDEVIGWIQSIRNKKGRQKNDGHGVFCIERLIGYGYTNEQISLPIMNNPFISYKHRIVTCMLDKKCPHYTEEKGYSGCPCEKCDDEKKR